MLVENILAFILVRHNALTLSFHHCHFSLPKYGELGDKLELVIFFGLVFFCRFKIASFGPFIGQVPAA